MSGDGHKGWLSGIDFAPHGRELATSAEDGTVKIWNFSQSRCVQTLVEHTQAVWDVAYMTDCPEFVASASMDHTTKLWDLTVGRCRQTFRGHVDSVNSVVFQPYANHLATASGDKTVSLWDCRSGLCAQTFYGHKNAVSSVTFALQGHMMASTDADGALRVWDVRKVAELTCARPPPTLALPPTSQPPLATHQPADLPLHRHMTDASTSTQCHRHRSASVQLCRLRSQLEGDRGGVRRLGRALLRRRQRRAAADDVRAHGRRAVDRLLQPGGWLPGLWLVRLHIPHMEVRWAVTSAAGPSCFGCRRLAARTSTGAAGPAHLGLLLPACPSTGARVEVSWLDR